MQFWNLSNPKRNSMDNFKCKFRFPHTKIAIYITIHKHRMKSVAELLKSWNWKREEGGRQQIIVFILSLFHFCILTHLAQLSNFAFAIFYAHCECASSGFFHQTCSFIKIVYLFACTHARRQTHRYPRTHTHNRGKQGNRPEMDGQHNQHRTHLRILIWILIRIRIASYFEFFLCALTLREREESEREREKEREQRQLAWRLF